MNIVSLSNGKRFEVLPDETILRGALRAGVKLDHSCETGRCGTCRTRLISGDTIAVASEFGLSDAERADGNILICARSAVGDIAIEMEEVDITLPPRKILACRIDELDAVSPSVLRVMMRLPRGSAFSYLPGQHIAIIGPAGIRRSYSIANAPRVDARLEFHIRHVAGGAMSRYWFEEAKINDLLRLDGPLGTFFLRDPAGRDRILLATGTGIAPVKAMWEAMMEAGSGHAPWTTRIFWGGRNRSDFYWRPPETGSGMDPVLVLSRPDPAWRGASGYVQDCALGAGVDFGRADVYACGSPAMIAAARRALVVAGLDQRRFFSDAFIPSDNAKH